MFDCVYIDKDRIQIWRYEVYLFSVSGVSFTFPTVVFYSLNIKLHVVLSQWIRILKMQPSLGKQRDKTTSAECDSATNNTIS